MPDGLQRRAAAMVDTVPNRRVHGRKYEQVLVRWDEDQLAMQPLNGRLPYPYSDEELRRVRATRMSAGGQPVLRSVGTSGRNRGSANKPVGWRRIMGAIKSPCVHPLYGDTQ
ncbi:MAG TPA: hypothetical protein VN428_02550 [Bryobacteraceae bacterium]|nr:hypothetical protein [Bryobacteraceae bacterium]